MPRTRLNVIDAQLLPWDELQPLSFVCEIRVAGHIDAERLRDAVRAAAASHPMARARLATSSWRDREQWWEIAEEVEVPLETVTCADDEKFESVRSRLRSRRIDLRNGPPFAVMIARRTGGDSLCVSLSHVASDGIGAYRLLRSILCAYAGERDEVRGPDPLSAHDLSFYNPRSCSTSWLNQLVRQRRLRRDTPATPPLTGEQYHGLSPVDDSNGSDYHLIRLDASETCALRAQRLGPATINDFLIATLALAVHRWNADQGVDLRALHIQMPLNLRQPEWATDVVGNVVADVPVRLSLHPDSNLESAQLAVAEQTQAAKARRASTELEVATAINAVPVALRLRAVKLMRRRVLSTTSVAMSNLGAVEFPRLPDDAGPVVEFWLGPSRGSPCETIATAAALRDELFLAVHRKTRPSGSAREFAEMWRNLMLNGVDASASAPA